MKKEQQKEKYDLLVIGGGPSGMMAAGVAAEDGKKVLLIEKNAELGKKLKITGGGRCNITNATYDVRKFLSKFGKSEQFLYSTFSVGKTFMISLVIILIVLAIPIVYATVTLGCPGISCNLGGCFCKYSIVSESCDCASICSAEGKSAVDAASSVNVFPDFKSLLSRNNLNCNCFCK